MHDGLSLILWSNDCNWPHFQAAPISHHQQTQSPLLILKVCVFPLKLTSFFRTALLQLARRQGPKSSAGFLKRNINRDVLIGWSAQEAVTVSAWYLLWLARTPVADWILVFHFTWGTSLGLVKSSTATSTRSGRVRTCTALFTDQIWHEGNAYIY